MLAKLALAVYTSPVLLGIVALALCAAVGRLGSFVFGKLRSKPKLAPLAPLALVAEDAAEAGVKAAAAAAGKGPLAALEAAGEAAEASAKKDLPEIEAALQGELQVLVDPNPTAETSSGLGVNLPTPGKTSGFARLGVLAALAAACLAGSALGQTLAPCTGPECPAAPAASTSFKLPPIDWKTVVFNHGPSTPLFEIDPKNPHPVQLAPGAGYSAGACFGQLTLNGSPTSLLCASAIGFADIASPTGVPAGSVQVAFVVGFLGGAAQVGPLLTPYTASGQGFLQGGRPGTDWVGSVNPVAIWHLLGGK